MSLIQSELFIVNGRVQDFDTQSSPFVLAQIKAPEPIASSRSAAASVVNNILWPAGIHLAFLRFQPPQFSIFFLYKWFAMQLRWPYTESPGSGAWGTPSSNAKWVSCRWVELCLSTDTWQLLWRGTYIHSFIQSSLDLWFPKDYIITPYIAEFVNTLTNLTYGTLSWDTTST